MLLKIAPFFQKFNISVFHFDQEIHIYPIKICSFIGDDLFFFLFHFLTLFLCINDKQRLILHKHKVNRKDHFAISQIYKKNIASLIITLKVQLFLLPNNPYTTY